MWFQIVGWGAAVFFAWAVIYGLVFHQKGPTYNFLSRVFRGSRY